MYRKENEKYIKLGLTGTAVVLLGLVIYFLLSHSAAIGGFFNTIVKILMPFLYGAVIAYLLAPLCGRIERFLLRLMPKKKGICAALSILLSMAAALLLVILLFLLVIPNVLDSIMQIITVLPSQLEAAVLTLHNLLETYPDLQNSWDELSSEVVQNFSAWLKTDLLTMVRSLLTSFSAQISGIATLVKNIFLGVLISVYFLASRRNFARQGHLLLAGIFPKKWADMIEDEIRYADRMFNGFLIGRVIDSVIIGIICFIVTSLFRFDSAVLVSVIVGVTNVIPVFGPFLGAIPCALILLLENPLHCLIFLIFVVILQLVDGNIIGPRILGQTTGVSSFWVLFSVMLFGGLWGILGMIIGVPLFAVIYDMIRKLTYHGLHRNSRTDLLPPEKKETDEEPEKEEDK